MTRKLDSKSFVLVFLAGDISRLFSLDRDKSGNSLSPSRRISRYQKMESAPFAVHSYARLAEVILWRCRLHVSVSSDMVRVDEVKKCMGKDPSVFPSIIEVVDQLSTQNISQ
jgi:hypothetical protein